MNVATFEEKEIKGVNRENKEISLIISNRKDNKAIKLTFNDYNEEFNNRVLIQLNSEQTYELIKALEPYLQHWNKKPKMQDKAYWEEINTFLKDVERTISLSSCHIGIELTLDCYTDKPYDDNWIELTPSKTAYFVGLLYGYMKSWNK